MITAILRIDPRSPRETNGVKGLGDYTIPADNKFQADGDPKTLGEIYAYGFRNAHRLSWDMTDGTLFVGDIGMNHIEEVNIVRNGGNYGWMKREGYLENGMIRPGGALNQLYELPGDVLRGRNRDEFIYPVAIYDHNEGVAITGAFPYHGRIEALRGKLIFGDVNRGRLFAADIAAAKAADDGVPETVAPIEEIQLYVRGPYGPAHLHVVPRARRGHDGHVADAHRSALGPQPRRRDLPHLAPGRHDPHARARTPVGASASATDLESTRMADNPYAPPRSPRRGRAESVARRRLHPRGPRRAGRQRLALDRGRVGVHGRAALDVHRRVPAARCCCRSSRNFIPIIGPLAVSVALARCSSAGSCSAATRVRRGERLEVGHLFAGFQRHAGKLLAARRDLARRSAS